MRINSEQGITLTETIIYVAILSVITVGMIAISLQLIQIKTKADTQAILSSEANRFLDKVIRDVRSCESFTVVSNSRLEFVEGGITKSYYLESGQVKFYDSLELTDISSDMVQVTDLQITDWTSVNSADLIHISITYERGNETETFETNVHKR